ncbi:MAG: hypothetical protein AB7G06_04855 [Bdellovibrionales bacterium]
MISIEYCHIDPYCNPADRIAEANEWLPRILKTFDGEDVQLCIMIDDFHMRKEIGTSYIENIIKQLKVKPHSVYLESAFLKHGRAFIDKAIANAYGDAEVNSNVEVIRSQNPKRTSFREYSRRYGFLNEFIVAEDKNKDGDEEVTCPVFAAASYLYRLGIKGVPEDVRPAWGEPLKGADRLLNVLHSSYLQVEDRAQAIVEHVDKAALRKISWFLY